MQCTECRIKDEQLAARNAMVDAKVVLIKQLREDNDTLAETLRLERENGILTPHESLPVPCDFPRQFLRIISSGVHGREDYFTVNPLVD